MTQPRGSADQYPDGVAFAVETPEGLLVDGANDVLIQHLAFRGVGVPAN